jgi:Collagen triple helix repeat (20 copies)
MLMRLRQKLTYANVVASLALVLALAGGTAYAANQMLPKNSVGTRQLKNGAVTKAKIAPGVLGATTAAPGPTGAQGPAGLAGVTGPSGAAGAAGGDGSPGNQGAPGAPGAPGMIVGPLPSGQSEQGQFVVHADPGTPPVGQLTEFTAIDFPIPLAADPIAAYVKFGEAPSADCPGPATEPTAAPGHLCVYELASINSTFTSFSNLIDEAKASQFGTSVVFDFENAIAGQDLLAAGTWAVTAP